MAKHTLDSLRADHNSLAPAYTRFAVADRLLLTGHSHQAWPDVARAAVVQAFDDAAEHVDAKWEHAFARAEAVRAGFRRLLDDPTGEIALCGSTHDALWRFLSALPWRQRRRLVTTDGEFHTVRRQLDRLGEEGVEIERVRFAPAETLTSRLIEALHRGRDLTAAVLLSTVSFERSVIVPHLAALPGACLGAGAQLFLDVYHQLNVAPFSVAREGLDRAFVTGGGYKYCQLGEGACFLRFPRDCDLRPIVTGWLAEPAIMGGALPGPGVAYGPGPARFAGATYDPVSHYRAAAVFDFFADEGLDVAFLRAVSQHQIGRLCQRFDALGLDPAIIGRDHDLPVPGRAGFVAFDAARAVEIVAGLRARGVAADARGSILRLGPAPYLSDRQLDDAGALLGETVHALP
jgi:kynureninase